jgi:hypothetical protein
MGNDNVAVAIPRELYDHMADVTGYQGETLNGWICGVLDAAHSEFGGEQRARELEQLDELKLAAG